MRGVREGASASGRHIVVAGPLRAPILRFHICEWGTLIRSKPFVHSYIYIFFSFFKFIHIFFKAAN